VSAWPEYLRKKMERGEVAREDEEKEFQIETTIYQS